MDSDSHIKARYEQSTGEIEILGLKIHMPILQ